MTTVIRNRSDRDYLDVVAVIGILVVLNAAMLTPPGNPLRIVLALVALLFVPGYALTTALFPERRQGSQPGSASLLDPTGGETERVGLGRAGLTDGERVALSFGFSLAMVPIYGFLLEIVWGEYSLTALAVTLTVSVVGLLLVGVYRRSQVSSASGTRFDGIRAGLSLRWIVGPDPRDADIYGLPTLGLAERRSQVISIALGIAVVVSVLSFGLAIATPSAGARYTEAYLVTESGGELTAMNYPTEPSTDDPSELVLVVENHEGRQVDYTAVVVLERVSPDGNSQPVRTMDRFSETLDPGETWRRAHQIAPDVPRSDMRVAYLIYRGSPPATPTRATAYRNLTIWLDPQAA